MSRQLTFELTCQAIERMKKAGWVKSYTAENPDSGFNMVWSEEGAEVLDTVWAMMEALGGNLGRGCEQSTWGVLAYFAIVRHRDPGLSPQFGN